jgi:hypothetical protein
MQLAVRGTKFYNYKKHRAKVTENECINLVEQSVQNQATVAKILQQILQYQELHLKYLRNLARY